MEEKELTQRFNDIFTVITPVLAEIRKGFVTQNEAAVKQAVEKYHVLIKSRVAHAESIIALKDKDAVEKRFINMFYSLQSISLGFENLMYKMYTKVKIKLLFSEKALNEITNLFNLIEAQLTDKKDYIMTKNPHLKKNVLDGKDQIIKLISDFDLEHQDRLIKGLCTPEASYLYLEMTDSFKRITRGLAELAEKA